MTGLPVEVPDLHATPLTVRQAAQLIGAPTDDPAEVDRRMERIRQWIKRGYLKAWRDREGNVIKLDGVYVYRPLDVLLAARDADLANPSVPRSRKHAAAQKPSKHR